MAKIKYIFPDAEKTDNAFHGLAHAIQSQWKYTGVVDPLGNGQMSYQFFYQHNPVIKESRTAEKMVASLECNTRSKPPYILLDTRDSLRTPQMEVFARVAAQEFGGTLPPAKGLSLFD